MHNKWDSLVGKTITGGVLSDGEGGQAQQQELVLFYSDGTCSKLAGTFDLSSTGEVGALELIRHYSQSSPGRTVLWQNLPGLSADADPRPSSDRRIDERLPTQLPAEVSIMFPPDELDTFTRTAIMIDISERGARVGIVLPVKVFSSLMGRKQEVQISLHDAPDLPGRIPARAVWLRPIAQIADEVSCTFAVEFQQMHPDSTAQVSSYMTKLRGNQKRGS